MPMHRLNSVVEYVTLHAKEETLFFLWCRSTSPKSSVLLSQELPMRRFVTSLTPPSRHHHALRRIYDLKVVRVRTGESDSVSRSQQGPKQTQDPKA